ncbi:hypothetical protein QTG54_014733 [Skeletonema marinoi]|uniref:Uncharacterized protein n=1 Tax=Skeletonema marinoi TaxID=267567 RepID=A0AAD8XW13_9STRA|nr:hypothetical protein QTG54_014733 [Skeletonema marinoi]
MPSSLQRLGSDELAHVFGFLPPEDIMRARLNKRMVEAAKKTIVPMTEFRVDDVREYNDLVAMSTALPNLQQIYFRRLNEDKYSDGDDPDEEEATDTANFITHDIEIISRFRKLRSLELVLTPLNGRYPFLFSFPLLHKLNITMCHHLKWDLEILEGLPLLKELSCCHLDSVTGNINSLRVLKDTLEKVTIRDCFEVQGNFMDLADFPRLKELDLFGTPVTGDIRDIGKQDFRTLELLTLPDGVYGGTGYEMQRISDAPDLAMAVYSIKKQRPTLLEDWHAVLSDDSPDWYDGIGSYDGYESTEPLCIRFVKAGSRVGYRWITGCCIHPCEVIWLDPEPQRESIDYETYIEAFQEIQLQVNIYRGFHQPPTEEEHNLLWASEGYVD